MPNGDGEIRTGPSGTQYKWDGSNWTPLPKTTAPSKAQASTQSFPGMVTESLNQQVGAIPGMVNELGRAYQHLPTTEQLKSVPGKMWEAAKSMWNIPGGAPSIYGHVMSKDKAGLASDVAGGALQMAITPDAGKPDVVGEKASPYAATAKTGTEALEKFRTKVRAKISKWDWDNARLGHAEIADEVDKFWNDKVHAKLKGVPTDPSRILQALRRLSILDPEIEGWVKNNIPQFASSMRAPLWEELRALDQDLTVKQLAGGTEETVRKAIPEAKAQILEIEKEAAAKVGADKDFVNARRYTRMLENIKHHTAYVTTQIKPASMFRSTGAAAGYELGSAAGGTSSKLGGAYIGGLAGSEVGKLVTPEGYKIPKASRLAERELWQAMGKKPPKGLPRTRVIPEAQVK